MDHDVANEPLERAASWATSGRGVALCTVIRTWGSSPRPVGSHLAVDRDGRFVGSVSGGCVEAAVVEAAREVIEAGGVRLVRHGVTDDVAWAVGLPCGGQLEVLIEAITDPGPLEAIGRARAARRSVGRVVALDSGSARLLWAEADTSDPLVDRVRGGRSGVVDTADGPVFVCAYPPRARLIVIGAVHVAQALVRLAAVAELDVVVVDPRTRWATPERLPGVLLDFRWPDQALTALAPDARTAVVALSHDPRLDDPALIAALATDACFVGALGSRLSHARRLDRLREAGVAEDALARIQGPVGLPIGARTPPEIAVSILAAVIAALRAPA